MKRVTSWVVATAAVFALSVNECGCACGDAQQLMPDAADQGLPPAPPPIPPEPEEHFADMTPRIVTAPMEEPSVKDLDFAVILDPSGELNVLVKDDETDEVITVDERLERRHARALASPPILDKSTTCDNLSNNPCDSVGLGLVGCNGMPDNRVITYCGWDSPNSSLQFINPGVQTELTHLASIANGSFLVQQKFPSQTVNPGICAGYQPCATAAGVSEANVTCMFKFAPLSQPTVTDLVFQNRQLNDGKSHGYCPVQCPGAGCPTFKPGAKLLMCITRKLIDQLDCVGCPGTRTWFNGCGTFSYTVDKGKVVTIDEAAVTAAMAGRGSSTAANQQLTCAAVGRSLGLDPYTTIAHGTVLGVFDTTGEITQQPSCMSVVPPSIINTQPNFDAFTIDEISNMVGPDAEGHPINRYAPPVFGTEE